MDEGQAYNRWPNQCSLGHHLILGEIREEKIHVDMWPILCCSKIENLFTLTLSCCGEDSQGTTLTIKFYITYFSAVNFVVY